MGSTAKGLTATEQAVVTAARNVLGTRRRGPAELEALRRVIELGDAAGARALDSEDTSPDLVEAADIAARAAREVGGGPWDAWSLREYDAARLGPLFGVSDNGDNATEIVRAFLDSPKARVLRRRKLLTLETIGACVDAERMTAAGELLVGPDEYAKVRRAAAGRVPMTTNVGTFVNPRLLRAPPFITYLGNAAGADRRARDEIGTVLAPYASPAEGPPRPVTVFVSFRGSDRVRSSRKTTVLRMLHDVVSESGDPSLHDVGLLQRASGRTSKAPKIAIDIAAAAGLNHVMIEAPARYESQDQVVLPGLFAFFDEDVVNEILEYGRKRSVQVRAKNRIDTDTVARSIWAGLIAARTMGAQLGKYGLVPLSLKEQVTTMAAVQPMITAWTPVPAFYVDRPVYTAARIFGVGNILTPLREWLDGAAQAGASVVLIDAPDRTAAPAGTSRRPYHEDRGRRLLKTGPNDRDGVLTLKAVDAIRDAARGLDVRILWAGGITAEQAFQLAERREFGIFTTSTTARRVAAPRGGDPSATGALQPTYAGVLAVRMAIEAGFLAAAAGDRGDPPARARIESGVRPVLDAIKAGRLVSASKTPTPAELRDLGKILEQEWARHLDRVWRT